MSDDESLLASASRVLLVVSACSVILGYFFRNGIEFYIFAGFTAIGSVAARVTLSYMRKHQ